MILHYHPAKHLWLVGLVSTSIIIIPVVMYLSNISSLCSDTLALYAWPSNGTLTKWVVYYKQLLPPWVVAKSSVCRSKWQSFLISCFRERSCLLLARTHMPMSICAHQGLLLNQHMCNLEALNSIHQNMLVIVLIGYHKTRGSIFHQL